MGIPRLARRSAIALQRCPWRIPSNFSNSRAGSTNPGSDIGRLSDGEATRKALEAAARENRLDFQTAARILMSSPQDERKFGWDFHLVQFFFACLPPLAVYGVAQYSRYDQRKMEKAQESKLENLIEAELEIELDVELEEVAAMLGSSSSDLQDLKLRLEAMEERLTRLEPAMQQPKEVSQKLAEPSTSMIVNNKLPDALQKGYAQKLKPATGDGRDGTSNQEKREGNGDGHMPWWRRIASSIK